MILVDRLGKLYRRQFQNDTYRSKVACDQFDCELTKSWPAIERVLMAAEAWRAARNRPGGYFAEADALEQALVALEAVKGDEK